MICLPDNCELINGLFLGVISSLIASGITLAIISIKNKKKLKKKFGKTEGEYLGYGYSVENPDLIIKDIPQSKATINYLKNNQLNIILTNASDNIKYQWSGTILLELENYGSLAWKYDIYKGNTIGNNIHKFGLKRVIINEDEKNYYVYLMDENVGLGEQYGKEILIRAKNNTRT